MGHWKIPVVHVKSRLDREDAESPKRKWRKRRYLTPLRGLLACTLVTVSPSLWLLLKSPCLHTALATPLPQPQEEAEVAAGGPGWKRKTNTRLGCRGQSPSV